MKAYYFDNLPGDQRLPHDSGTVVTSSSLDALGVLHWSIPRHDGWESEINRVASERDYKNRDVVLITKEGLGDAYESKIRMFYAE
jgi:1,2-dihydroxy-3-keto-5-methylthiopentene dioxygenase